MIFLKRYKRVITSLVYAKERIIDMNIIEIGFLINMLKMMVKTYHRGQSLLTLIYINNHFVDIANKNKNCVKYGPPDKSSYKVYKKYTKIYANKENYVEIILVKNPMYTIINFHRSISKATLHKFIADERKTIYHTLDSYKTSDWCKLVRVYIKGKYRTEFLTSTY